MFNNKKAIVMYFKNYPNIKIALAMIILLGLFSCGSYQYASDNDGIYTSEPQVVYVEEVEQPADANVSYYQNYFKEKRMQYDSMKEESEIFTDVNSYSSENGENYREQDSLDNSYNGYGSWGADSNEVVVNIYDNSWINPYWGWGWNVGWGWGWNSWYNPYWGWGWNAGWGWNVGWGWNAGWGYPYYGWGWNAGWGYGWCNPYYGGGYYYGSRGVAISGRRGADYLGYNNRNSLNSRNTLASNGRSNSLTRDYDAIRSSNIRSTTRSSYTPTRSIRTRSNLSTPRTRSTNSFSNSRSRYNNSSISNGRTRSNNTRMNSSSSRSNRSSSSGRSFSSPSRGSSGGGSRSSSGGGGRRR